MYLRLLTITQKLPAWLKTGYADYSKRLSPIPLELIEVPAEKRFPHSDIQKIINQEGEKLLKATKPHHKIIALDMYGELWSTETLAHHLKKWQMNGESIDFLVGGADGLSKTCLQQAHLKWSLSPLTFPHFLVRLIIAEQLYRAFSILSNHPYHR